MSGAQESKGETVPFHLLSAFYDEVGTSADPRTLSEKEIVEAQAHVQQSAENELRELASTEEEANQLISLYNNRDVVNYAKYFMDLFNYRIGADTALRLAAHQFEQVSTLTFNVNELGVISTETQSK